MPRLARLAVRIFARPNRFSFLPVRIWERANAFFFLPVRIWERIDRVLFLAVRVLKRARRLSSLPPRLSRGGARAAACRKPSSLLCTEAHRNCGDDAAAPRKRAPLILLPRTSSPRLSDCRRCSQLRSVVVPDVAPVPAGFATAALDVDSSPARVGHRARWTR